MQATNNPHTILKKHFGFDQFRPLQEEIITGILNQKDTLVLMPTGGGKSVCFQLPAILMPHITLVVSPLIALMKDQVGALKANGIAADFLNSSMDESEQNDLIDKLKLGSIKLLYLSPEKLLSLASYLEGNIKVSLIAIDEAHCISQWGHDFRPEYTKLAQIRELWPQVPVIALTATADKITRKDIVKQLNLKNPTIFIASFDRPNLNLSVRFGVKKKQKLHEISDFIDAHKNESGIIYCLSRKATEEMASDLREFGILAECYHAGLSAEQRNTVQDNFINDRTKVICATIAFGMGIDKSNVRFVIHNSLPKNMEGYYQEIGRAGRDGLPSDTLLYYSLGDIVLLRTFIESSGQKELNYEKLNRMQQYAETPICRRKILLAYFGETLEKPCNNCDVCKQPRSTFDGTLLAQKALSALVRTNENVGSNLLIDILRGSHRKEIIENNYDKIKTYGAGKELSFGDWQKYILQILNLGLIEIAYDENHTLKVSDFGKEVLFGRKSIELVKTENLKDFEPKKKRNLEVDDVKDLDKELFDYLRSVRRQFSEKENVPAYVIFSDATLQELSEKKPISISELLHINGMGEYKIKKYGNTFVKEIKQWLRNNDVKAPKGNTYKETFELLNEGYSIEEIAETRKIHTTTIYSHIAQLYSKNELDSLDQYINKAEIDIVKKAVSELGETKQLTPIFNHLNQEIPFHIIRLCLAYIEKEKN